MSLSIAMLSPDVAKLGGAAPAAPAAAATKVAPQESFAETLAAMANDALTTIKGGETAAMAGMQGKASLQQVVEAVMHAEQTLQTVVAVRDKVVGAYLEISRMQI
jgi:flagellar hook-basal body complex protein FliE